MGGGRLGKVKSAVIGGIINVSVPIMLVVVLDNGGRNVQTNLFPYFCGQLIAGVIAGFLVSAILNSADKEQEENYE